MTEFKGERVVLHCEKRRTRLCAGSRRLGESVHRGDTAVKARDNIPRAEDDSCFGHFFKHLFVMIAQKESKSCGAFPQFFTL